MLRETFDKGWNVEGKAASDSEFAESREGFAVNEAIRGHSRRVVYLWHASEEGSCDADTSRQIEFEKIFCVLKEDFDWSVRQVYTSSKFDLS